jgi:nicotinate-nucleotide adenylyltransferase
MRLGVLGGTFDPIHYGHLLAAEATRAHLKLDKVLFVPAGMPPHKTSNVISPPEHRLAMVRLAVASNPHFALSTVDLDRPGPHYTTDMVTILREEWSLSADDCYFIMGYDSLLDLPTWHKPSLLMQLCRLAVAHRPGYPTQQMEEVERVLPGIARRVDFVPMPLLDIASHELRERVRTGLPIKYLLPEQVERYIYEHGLYRLG